MAEYKLIDGGVQHTITKACCPNDEGNRDWRRYLIWVSMGNTPDPMDPEPPPPTNEELYDRAITNNKLVKALVLSLNDGSFVPGNNLSNLQLRTFFKDKM